MRELDRRHIVGQRFGMLLGIARENEPRLGIDEAENQPRAAHAIDFRAWPREPRAAPESLRGERRGRANFLRMQRACALELHACFFGLRRVEKVELTNL